jgi:methyltransferase (TIGR00027 family)
VTSTTVGSIRRRVESRQSDTAEINAAQRAAEALQPPSRRLFHDPYARHFVGRPGYRLISSSPAVARAALRLLDRWAPGLHVHILLRARYAMERVKQAAWEGADQVVLLGAGFDSTAMRHDRPRVTFYEVDSPATQRAKRERLDRNGLEPRHPTVYVPCDFERDSVGELLADTGFERERRSVVVWLGVSMYLTRRAFDRALDELAQLCSPWSNLVLDYMDPAVVDGSSPYVGARRLRKSVARRGEPYRLGFAPGELSSALQERGFEVTEHLRTPELADRYGGEGGVWCSTDDYLGVITATRRSDG